MVADFDVLTMIEDTLYGDLRDAILDRLKAMPKPWTVMSELEQREMIEGINRVSHHLVRQAVHLIAANGHPHMMARIESISAKDELKIILKASSEDPIRHDVFDAIGAGALLVLADPSKYMGEKAPAKPDPDEPMLPGTDKENVRHLKGRKTP